MYYTKIDWMEMEKEGHYQTLDLIDEDDTIAGKLCERQINVIIGTDVVYWRSSIDPLVKTVDVLFNAHD